jgi:hypothetical protein
MPIIKGFRSTTIWKAFTLNALATSLIVVVAVAVKDRMDKFERKGEEIERKSSARSILFTFGLTFAAAYISYAVLYFLFGFGGGMLAEPEELENHHKGLLANLRFDSKRY